MKRLLALTLIALSAGGCYAPPPPNMTTDQRIQWEAVQNARSAALLDYSARMLNPPPAASIQRW